MLPDAFLTWWLTPWAYATNPSSHLPLAVDRVGQRDGYRLWCEQADIDPDFPERFDPAWSIAATENGAELTGTARLFAGLIAAREHHKAVLDALPPMDRKWCVSVAATQPLCSHPLVRFTANDTAEVRGLLELARHLEQDFRGMWPRLRLLLSAALADRVGDLLQAALTAPDKRNGAVVRAPRCWRLCRERAASAGLHEQTIAALTK